MNINCKFVKNKLQHQNAFATTNLDLNVLKISIQKNRGYNANGYLDSTIFSSEDDDDDA